MKPWKDYALGGLLVGIAVIGPLVAYAAVNVIYPSSEHTLSVLASPPITFDDGEDAAQATRIGFMSSWAGTNSNASFTLTLAGLSGGNFTIDKYINITHNSSVTSYKLQIAAAASGTLDAAEIQYLRIRAWTGGTAPTADTSSGVCAYLNLEDPLDTESSGSCTGSYVYVQVVFNLASSSAGSSTVSIRPSSIVFV